MQADDGLLRVYLDLADMYRKQQDPSMREVFLMLAADTALRTGQPRLAEQLRQEILLQNPHHVLKPFGSFAEAARHPDIEGYLDDLRLKYSREIAVDLLETVIPAGLPPPEGDLPATMPPQPRSPRAPLTPPPVARSPAPPTREEPPEKPLKVYRESYEIDETQPPPTLPPMPRPRAQPRPAPPPAPVPPPRTAAPRPAPAPIPRPPTPRAAAPTSTPGVRPTAPPEPEDDRTTPGAWVGTLLYLLILAAGVAMAMWALVPHELLAEL